MLKIIIAFVRASLRFVLDPLQGIGLLLKSIHRVDFAAAHRTLTNGRAKALCAGEGLSLVPCSLHTPRLRSDDAIDPKSHQAFVANLFL